MKNIHRTPRHLEKEREQLRRISFQRKLRKIVIGVGIIILIWFFIGGDLGIISMFRSIRYREYLEKVMEAEEKKSSELTQKIEKLSTDTFFIEQVARTKYGMVKDGETVFLFPPEKPNSNK
ncbi:hypothetical protein DRQ33_02200 [bacterium]|nr:MAG: hypothetical protein DRQ33_02200 [bacterium]